MGKSVSVLHFLGNLMKYLFASLLLLVGFLEFVLRVLLILLTICTIIGIALICEDEAHELLSPKCWRIMEKVVIV